MSSIISPNMNLVIPGVGSEAGPQYATDINNSLTIIDSHNHSPGSGVQITPSGMNINSALTLNNNFLTNAAGLSLLANSTPGTNGTAYRSGVDLYYVDGNGANIAITSSGSIAGAPGNISGLTPPATASYDSVSKTFIFESNSPDAGDAANMDVGSLLLRNTTSGSSFSLTVSPPSLSGNHSIVLPVPNGSGVAFLTIDNTSGIISNNVSYPLFAAGIASNAGILGSQLSASAGIVGTQLANSTITTTQISNSANITGGQLDSAANISANQLNTNLSATQLRMVDSVSGTLHYSKSVTTSQTASQVGVGSSVTTMTNFTITPEIQQNLRPLFFCFSGGDLNISGGNAATQMVVQVFGVTGGSQTLINAVNLTSIVLNTAIGTLPPSILNFITPGLVLPTNHTFYKIVVTLTSVNSSTVSLTLSNVTFTVLQV